MGRIAAADRLDRRVGQLRHAGIDAAHLEPVAADIGKLIATRQAQFVDAFVPRGDEGAFGPQPRLRSGVDRHIGGASDADQLALDTGRIGQWSHQIEDRPLADALTDRLDAPHRRVVVLGEQETDAEFGQRLLCSATGCFHVQPERLQRVCSAGFAAGGAIAVLGHRHARCGDHQANGGRDVERVVAVAAGAAAIHGILRRSDRHEPGAQGPRGPGDLVAGFAALGHRDQKNGHVVVRDFAIEDPAEHFFRFALAQPRFGVGKLLHAGPFASIPHMRRKLASSAWPCSVAMLSG